VMFTITGLFTAQWSGRLERGKMIVLSLVNWAPLALAMTGIFHPVEATFLMAAQLVDLAVIAAWLCAPVIRKALTRPNAPSWRDSPLKRYIFAGLTIGLMSPASIMWSRAELAHGLSWDEVSQLQALWRTNEWVTGLAGSLIGLVYLPRMAAATDRTAFLHQIQQTWVKVCIPGTIAIALLWALQGIVIPILYSDKYIMSAAASGLFLFGDALRLASWVPLQGMFATERTKAIAIGEWLSLPLFAALLTVLSVKSLVVAGALYAVTYAIYLVFNAWCVYRTPGRYKQAAEPEPSASPATV